MSTETDQPFTQLIVHAFQTHLDERLERELATTTTDVLARATRLCDDRVRAALPPLLAPTEHRTLVAAVTAIGVSDARSAAMSLLTKSVRIEFLKRIALRKRTIVKESNNAATKASAMVATTATVGRGGGEMMNCDRVTLTPCAACEEED